MSVNCPSWKDGKCLDGCYGGQPPAQVCNLVCRLGKFKWVREDKPRPTRKPSRPRGLGDSVARIIKLATAKASGCGGCDKRRQWLNWLVPYRPMREVVMRLVLVALVIAVIALLVWS